jgi:hypothetical protein
MHSGIVSSSQPLFHQNSIQLMRHPRNADSTREIARSPLRRLCSVILTGQKHILGLFSTSARMRLRGQRSCFHDASGNVGCRVLCSGTNRIR